MTRNAATAATTRARKPRGEYAKSAATRTAILDAALRSVGRNRGLLPDLDLIGSAPTTAPAVLEGGGPFEEERFARVRIGALSFRIVNIARD